MFLRSYVYQTKDSLRLNTKTNPHTLEKGSVKKELKYGVLVFFATGLITLFYTSSILIMKHYFSAHEAGLYSGVSAIATIIFFAIAPSSAVLLSSIKIKHSFATNALALKKALVISLVIGGCGMVTFYVFHDLVISLMLGHKYVPFGHFLPKAGLVMLLTAMANVFVFYFLALRRFFLIGISLVGVLFMGLILFQGYTSIDQVLNNLLLAITIIVLALIGTYAKDYFHYYSRI